MLPKAGIYIADASIFRGNPLAVCDVFEGCDMRTGLDRYDDIYHHRQSWILRDNAMYLLKWAVMVIIAALAGCSDFNKAIGKCST